VPLTPAEFTVTEDVPLDVSVSDSVALEPTVTSPKLRLDGLVVSPSEPVPVPLRLTVAVKFVATLLFTVSVPVADPVVVGANFTLNVSVAFGFNVTGNVAPDTVYPVPLTLAELIVSADVPLDVNVTDCVDD
jgi:hypothetical protein